MLDLVIEHFMDYAAAVYGVLIIIGLIVFILELFN